MGGVATEMGTLYFTNRRSPNDDRYMRQVGPDVGFPDAGK